MQLLSPNNSNQYKDGLYLQDLDKPWKHRVPAHSDQRHIGEHLRDDHRRQGGHWRSVVGTSSNWFSSCVVAPGLRTFSAVLRETRAASLVPEQPPLDVEPRPGVPSIRRDAVLSEDSPSPWRRVTTMSERPLGRRSASLGMEPPHDGFASPVKAHGAYRGHRGPVLSDNTCWASVQKSSSIQKLLVGRHVSKEATCVPSLEDYVTMMQPYLG